MVTYTRHGELAGDLYVAVDSQIVRYSANGQVTEIWLKDHGDLGRIHDGNGN